MAYVHTFKLAQGGVETRKSETRQYQACIVLTATTQTVSYYARATADAEAEVADRKAKLAASVAAHGITAEQARETCDRLKVGWNERHDEAHGRLCLEADRAGRSRSGTWDAAKAELRAAGIQSPHEGPHAEVSEAAYQVDRSEERLAWIRKETPRLGDERVLSWHLSTQNASKSTGNAGLNEQHGGRGNHVAIRTDFTVKETGKHTKKAAS